MGGSMRDDRGGIFGWMIDAIVWLMVLLCGGPKKDKKGDPNEQT